MTGAAQTTKIPPPPPVAQKVVRRILGFGVWVAVGLAPFLGALRIPGFNAVLELYPASSRLPLLSFSGLMMGTIALVIENAGAGRLTRKGLERWFRRGLIALAVSFALLVVLYPFLVTRAEYQSAPPPALAETQAFITGALAVPAQPSGSECTCPAGQAAEQCVKDASFKESNVRTCFGPLRVTLAGLALTLLHLTLTGSFAWSVGVFVLRHSKEGGAARR